MVVVWSKSAKADLKKAFDYISLDSAQNAQMVADTIVSLTVDLAKNPEKHPLDKFKNDNDNTWRAFEKFHYRISYQILGDRIYIVRLRHTSRSPLNY